MHQRGDFAERNTTLLSDMTRSIRPIRKVTASFRIVIAIDRLPWIGVPLPSDIDEEIVWMDASK